MFPLSNTTPGARKWWISLLSPTQLQEQGSGGTLSSSLQSSRRIQCNLEKSHSLDDGYSSSR